MLGSPARDGRNSLTRPPASRTSSPPAIQSHGWSTDSKYASNRPLATYARSRGRSEATHVSHFAQDAGEDARVEPRLLGDVRETGGDARGRHVGFVSLPGG